MNNDLIKELSPYRQIVYSALLNWGMAEDEEEAYGIASGFSLKELEEKVGATKSINAGLSAIAKLVGLNLSDLNKYTYSDNRDDVSINFVLEQLSKVNFADESVISVLNEIHKSWVFDKFEANFNKQGREDRQFQHLPTELIGWEEVKKDLLFVTPILESMGVKLDEEKLEKLYNNIALHFAVENGIVASKNLDLSLESNSDSLIEIINDFNINKKAYKEFADKWLHSLNEYLKKPFDDKVIEQSLDNVVNLGIEKQSFIESEIYQNIKGIVKAYEDKYDDLTDELLASVDANKKHIEDNKELLDELKKELEKTKKDYAKTFISDEENKDKVINFNDIIYVDDERVVFPVMWYWQEMIEVERENPYNGPNWITESVPYGPKYYKPITTERISEKDAKEQIEKADNFIKAIKFEYTEKRAELVRKLNELIERLPKCEKDYMEVKDEYEKIESKEFNIPSVPSKLLTIFNPKKRQQAIEKRDEAVKRKDKIIIIHGDYVATSVGIENYKKEIEQLDAKYQSDLDITTKRLECIKNNSELNPVIVGYEKKIKYLEEKIEGIQKYGLKPEIEETLEKLTESTIMEVNLQKSKVNNYSYTQLKDGLNFEKSKMSETTRD